MTRESYERDMATLRAKRDTKLAALKAAFAESAAIVVADKRGGRELWILSGTTSRAKGHRVTFFLPDGPRGHDEDDDLEKLYLKILDWNAKSYTPVDDAAVMAWTSTPEFAVGARRVAYMQALNTLSYLQSKATTTEDKHVLLEAMTRARAMEDEEKATAFMERVIHAHTPRKNPTKMDIAPIRRHVHRLLAIPGLSGDDVTKAKVSFWSPDLERRAKKRDFAMVDVETREFLFSPRLASLDHAHRNAIIAHEVGHVIAWETWNDDSEEAADRAAKNFIGTDISYDHAYPGKGLQVCTVRNNPAFEIREEDFDLIENPTPWVTNVLSTHFTELEQRVPPKWLPKIAKTKARGTTFTGELTEFGCGAYGCVLPTLDPKVVLKVTTDDSEAEFAAKLAQKLPTAVCVAYFKVLHVQGQTRGPRDGVRHDGAGAPIYLLWREEASEVGKVDKVVGPHAEQAIHAQHAAAMEAFIALKRGQDARALLERWRGACRAMGEVPELAFVSDGLLRAFDEAKIFISDTHGGNLGLAMRNGSLTWVITDPGNVVVMTR